jgi:hypothetical protein
VLNFNSKSFELNWCVLTARQQNWLLAELERLLLSNVRGRSLRKTATSSPTVHQSSVFVVQSQKKSKKKKKRTIVSATPANRGSQPCQFSLQTSYFDTQSPPSAVSYRHSPQQVGSDGVSSYDRTIYSNPAEASKFLDRKEAERISLSHPNSV